MERFFSLIRLHDVFRGLSSDDVREIVNNCKIAHFEKGEIIHDVGEKIEHASLVLSGSIAIRTRAKTGEYRTIHHISAGGQFGALITLVDEDIAAILSADEPSMILNIPKTQLENCIGQFPRFRKNLMRMVGSTITNKVFPDQKKIQKAIVGFVSCDNQTNSIVVDLANRLKRAGERISVLADCDLHGLERSIPFKAIRPDVGIEMTEQEIDQWPEFDHVFVVVERQWPDLKLQRLIKTCNQIFWMASTDNYEPQIKHMSCLLETSRSWKEKLFFIWSLRADDNVVPFVPELADLVTRDFKVQQPGGPNDSRLHRIGITGLTHFLRGLSIGIALSGGAAHGMAHLGVLKALEEAGITFDILSGTSAGVLTGVVYCAGLTADYAAQQFATDLDPGSFYKHIPMGDGVYLLRKYRTHEFDPMLRRYINDWRLEQLPIPSNTVTTDLISAKSIVRSTGDAVNSILESINLPILSPPICRDGMLLIDGGFLNNLPADVLVDKGCNFIIGVDVSANIDQRVGDNTPETPADEMKSPGIVRTLLRTMQVQGHGMNAVGANPADVIIAPDVSQFEATEFNQAKKMAEIGYQATLEVLPRIKEILHDMDPGLYPE